MATLEEKINEINKVFDEKENAAISALKEERELAISKAVVDDTLENLPGMSLGNIITIFENISPDLIKTKGGKKAIANFVSLVKEDINIRNVYVLKENLIKNVGISNPREFITESIETAKETSDAKTIKESKKKLVSFVSEAISMIPPKRISEKIAVDEKIKSINENIDVLLWGKKTIKNAGARINSMNEAVKFLSNINPTESKEDVFESYKNQCIKTIDEAWKESDTTVRMKLTEMKDKLSKKMYSELTADDDIKYMKELIQTIK